jgi:adenine nucleotide transporter 17
MQGCAWCDCCVAADERVVAACDVAVLQGIGGFYKGMRVKLLQTVLAAALLMMLKEEIFAATRQLLVMAAPAGRRRRVQRR